MLKFSKTSLVLGALTLGITGGFAAAAVAQSSPSTPKGWNYEIKDGKRVPKGKRQTNADGSWREEVRQGPCVTVKERTPNGEYKESRRCD
jgi:transcription initiation factor TFIID subunit TAF12